MKTIIHSVAMALLLIAAASAGTVTRVDSQGQKATIAANLGAGEELRIFIGEESLGWSAPTGAAAPVQATVTASDQIPLEDGSKGKGLILQMSPTNTFNVAIVKDGPVPFGEVVFRPANQITKANGVWTFADIRQADGKLVPISAKVRSGGNW